MLKNKKILNNGETPLNLDIMKRVMDSVNTCIYVSDAETDEILYINKMMRNAFGGGDLVGKTCWKVLQQGMTERCPFCPTTRLLEGSETEIVWEEHNSVNGRYYTNTDTLIEWTDGRKVHIQHSLDITDIKLSHLETEKQYKQQEMISSVLMNFASSADLNTIINNVLEILAQFFDAARSYLYTRDKIKNLFRIMHEWKAPETPSLSDNLPFIPFEPEGVLVKTLMEQGVFVATNMKDYSLLGDIPLGFLENKNSIFVPVFVDEMFWGVLGLGFYNEVREWDAASISPIKTVGNIFSSLVKRRMVEDSLHETQETLRQVLDTAPVYIFWKDKNYVYRGINKQFSLFQGVKGEVFIGGTDYDFFDNETAERHTLEDKHIMETGQAMIGAEEMYKTKTGEERWVRISKVPLYGNDGEITSVLGVFEDVTENKRSLMALEKSEKELKEAIIVVEKANNAKSEFLSRMSHEIRTPLNAIIGMTRIAENSDEISKIKECLEKINRSSKHLLAIINDILDMSKIEANKLELNHEKFNFENMLMNVCNVVTVKADEKSLDFQVIIDNNVPSVIVGDELRLSQIIANLLSNAVKFTPEHGVVSMHVALDDEYNNCADDISLKFTVRDTGIGMTPEQVSRLFSPFEQADGGIARKYGGTGLGLTISKHLVELVGGKIWVESEKNVGTSFYFTIKLGKAPALKGTSLSTGIDKSNLKLLIVDDSADIRDFFIKMMDNMGIAADAAEGSVEALKLIETAFSRKEPYNIIFVDWRMPGIDGIATAKIIKTLFGDNTVVILISIAEWKDIAEEAEKIGITKFISKPLFPSTIINTINEIMGVTVKRSKLCPKSEIHDFTCKKILVAEDVEINREIIAALLSDTGAILETAENGVAAVAKFSDPANKYDLILMDIHMPEMDGLEATRRIRAIDSDYARSVPIVAMTANAFKEDVEKCTEAGMNAHIAKPVDEDIFMRVLFSFLGNAAKDRAQTVADYGEDDIYADYLPYIDAKEGLARLKRNKKLYAALLRTYLKNDFISDINMALSNNDFAIAGMHAHTLKGIAANLSLNSVYAESSALEQYYKADKSSPKTLDNLHKIIEKTASVINDFLIILETE